MMRTYEVAKFWIKQDEGGYSNDPQDPGGPTNFGITLYDYRTYIDSAGTAESVRDMKFEQAAVIYKQRYWDMCSCDKLPVGVDYMVFDTAILQGVVTACRFVQRSVGVDADGKIGPVTMAAVDRADPVKLLLSVEALRRQRLRLSPHWARFGKGWTNRVNKAVARSKKLIEAAHGQDIIIPQAGVATGPALVPA